MRRTAANAALGGILALLVLLTWFGQRDYREPNLQLMPDMVDSAPFDAFSPNPNFADGKTLQTPPPGTIARGRLALPYGSGEEGAARAGRELVNPFASADAVAVDRGAAMYRRFCVPCHGPTGTGDGTVAQRGFPPPPSLHSDRARAMMDGQIFHIITFGQGNMPPHAAQISPDDRWRAILHVRRLQERATTAAADAGSGSQS